MGVSTGVRAKFLLSAIHSHHHTAAQTFVFTPQYDASIAEDQRFSKATPNGRFEMYVDNPSAQQTLKLGAAYYLDLTEVPAADPAAAQSSSTTGAAEPG
jgi:hypothetical protein